MWHLLKADLFLGCIFTSNGMLNCPTTTNSTSTVPSASCVVMVFSTNPTRTPTVIEYICTYVLYVRLFTCTYISCLYYAHTFLRLAYSTYVQTYVHICTYITYLYISTYVHVCNHQEDIQLLVSCHIYVGSAFFQRAQFLHFVQMRLFP